MYRIGDILEQALLVHQCVVLPSIGAFIVEQTPAEYDEVLNQIIPEGQRVSFNADLSERDGILDSYYARLMGLSARRARLVVDTDIATLRQEIYRFGSVSLSEGIGVLSLQDNGELLFTPSCGLVAFRSIQSYGLYPQSSMVTMTTASADRTQASDSQRSEGRKDSKYWTLRINRTATNWAAAIAVCILCLIPVSSDRSTDRYSAGFVPDMWHSAVSSSSDESASLIDETVSNNTVSNSVAPQAKPAEIPTHTVVLAVFKSKNRASHFVEEHVGDVSEADAALYVLDEGSRCLVVSGKCYSEDQARELRAKIAARTPAFKDAWVYKLKQRSE